MKTIQLLRLISIINSLLIIPACSAQNPAESLLEDILEDLSVNNDIDNSVNTLNWENELEELSNRMQEPVNLNVATREQLEQFPFLSDIQIEHLLAYIYIHGQMKTIYELQLVEEMDRQTIQYLLPFVCIKAINNEPAFRWKSLLKNAAKYGKNELLTRFDIPFYRRKGYEHTYLGPSVYNSVKYSFRYSDRLYAGVVAEKDAGEPFGALHNRYGYDYYSFYLLLKDCGRLKALAIGNYRLSFGQGLVISNDFSPSRTAVVAQAERRTNGFRRHFSTNEQDFFCGVASTITIKNLDISVFYSYRKMDAGVDSLTFTSLKTDGLHRLQRDWEKRKMITMQVYGGNIRYATSHFHVGLTALSYSFGKFKMDPDPKPYNLFYFRGSNNFNIGVDYMLKSNRIKFYGETALSKNGAISTLNALQLTPASYISFLVLYRYYDRRYQALFGNAFSQGSTVQNEQGVYMGLQLTPIAHWKLSVYADLFRFPWLKYGIDAPSGGQEYMAQIDYTPSRNYSAYLRYKYRQKEKNGTFENDNLLKINTYKQHRIGFQQVYNFSSPFIFKTSLDGILFDDPIKKLNKGIMISQSIGWKPTTLPLQMDGYLAWFHTDDYNSRVSSYEKNILYAFNMPSFYGDGMRFALTFRLDIWKRLSLSANLAHTHYWDRDLIGTDTEEISGSDKTDLYALLRWKF